MQKSSRRARQLAILVACSLGLITLAMVSSARSTNQLTIVNNSNRVIVDVYLSPVNSDLWGDDQTGEGSIAPGQSFTFNVACDQQQIKVIGEDQEGCFLSTVIDCGSDATWTITNSTPVDCDGD